MPVAEICRRAGISQATHFNWKKKYDGLLPKEMKRLTHIEDEYTRLSAIFFAQADTRLIALRSGQAAAMSFRKRRC